MSEFDAHGVEMNQHYASRAVVAGAGDERQFHPDPELISQPSSCPGARLPHAWLEKDRTAVSTLDVTGRGRFTVLTGIGGTGWRTAVARLAAAGLPIDCASIGPGEDYEDPFGDWASARGTEDDGALLVRPDHVIAWRQCERANDCASALRDVLARIMDK